VFERFTDRARQVVVLAQDEARELNHGYIGTEHLLLGLLRSSDGIAARSLESLGISLSAVRQQVTAIVGAGPEQPSGHIPFTPRAKKVLELALREALKLDHNYIGTEHILLGLLSEGEGVAAQVLTNLGATLPAVRQSVVELLGTSPTGSTFAMGGASHEVVAAALRDSDSAAARALSAAGVDVAALIEALDAASVEGTSDERPEQRGRRQLTLHFDGETVALTATDDTIVAAARELWARWELEPDAHVAGTDQRAAPMADAWAALHRAVTAMASGRRVTTEITRTTSVSSMVGRSRRRRRRPPPDPQSHD
jgi:ATP-dependent Clp protease ATP-binding subunit ClpA